MAVFIKSNDECESNDRLIKRRVGFVGAGNMAQAIVTGMLEAGKNYTNYVTRETYLFKLSNH